MKHSIVRFVISSPSVRHQLVISSSSEKKGKKEKEKKRKKEKKEKKRKREKGKKRTQGEGEVSSSISWTFLELRSSYNAIFQKLKQELKFEGERFSIEEVIVEGPLRKLFLQRNFPKSKKGN